MSCKTGITNLLEILICNLDVLELRSEVYELVLSCVEFPVTVEQFSLLESLL